jgi:hypothetical protein
MNNPVQSKTRRGVGAAVTAILLAHTHNAKAEDLQCSYVTLFGSPWCLASIAGTDQPNQTGSYNGNGLSGAPGGPTDSVSVTQTSVPSGLSVVRIGTQGGNGGGGSPSVTGDFGLDKSGGNGGAGGLAGDVTATLGSAVGATSTLPGFSALTIIAQGGAGGYSGQGSFTEDDSGTAGRGGNGGAITATVDGNWRADGATRSATISSQGGAGGSGGNYATGLAHDGGDAAAGGDAGNVNVTLLNSGGGSSNQFNAGLGVLIQSVGGTAGNGGDAESVDGSQGGAGGAGGNAGTVNATIGANVIIGTSSEHDAALYVLSLGGQGGTGGAKGGSGGIAGAAGNANNVAVSFQGGSLQSIGGDYSPGLLAQSLGGNGGDGGAASSFVIGPNGGSGATGGTAGTVSVTGSGVTIVTGEVSNDPTVSFGVGSAGVLAQSIGGGGGGGAPSKGIFAVGGDGGNAVHGNTVTVDLQSQTTTYGFGANGIEAQSIGGGGGKGGDASGSSVGIQLVIGGTGGAGGTGGLVSMTNEAGSVVTTYGDHASSLVEQSIGGGGGDGGAAYSEASSKAFGAAMAVGGAGGAGGDGGVVTYANKTTNASDLLTYGSDSFGILAQSIGGGGGVGGASTAKAEVSGGSDYPSISLAAALGGSGGVAGNGNSVTVGNAGLIATTGSGSTGVLAQSIGGGGGAGGDAHATATASGGNYGLSASFAFGGQGGAGGSAGTVNALNSGVILTTGESADGMMVQSIGGGGGIGGAGDAQAKSSGGGTTISGSIAMGGNGGGAGDGNSVTAINNGGAIMTLGDGAIGIGAQAVGGGGGRAGGGAASTQGTYSASLSLGGNGGSGGSTYAVNNVLTSVTVINDAVSTIVTFGADATGILAQSIGGGGGIGGKSASNLATSKSTGDGGNGSSNSSTAIDGIVTDFKNNGFGAINNYNNLSGAISTLSNLLGVSSSLSAVGDDDPEADLDTIAQSRGKTADSNESSSIQLQVSLGGSGGNGGSAGAVLVNNAGEVATLGAHSDAIIAQAVGGGGGKGGAASTASTNDYSGSVTVGGTGGAGGNGGQPVVINSGSIITMGALSNGIVAQSVAGGGGIGGVSASSVSSSSKNSGNATADDGGFKALQISLGGNGGAGGEAGQVYVTNSGSIVTQAHDSSGIIAQSVAGGGGIVKTLATDLEAAGGSASANQTDYDINFKFGGDNGSAGQSGLVNVKTTSGGTITTKGDDSYGILAQSISGGGGVVLGGKPTGSSVDDFFGTGMHTGTVLNDGVNNPTSGNSGLFVDAGDNITTSGKGAIGILAQSIGGGGGLAGDTGATSTPVGFAGSSGQFNGSGGYVGVTVDAGATVSTSGDNAPAIFVQSVGGGGGRITTAGAAYMGTAGGSGQGGTISVVVEGTVQATGQGSAGIVAQSMGDSTSNSPITITIGQTGKVIVGQSNVPTSPFGESAAIYINHGGMDEAHANEVVNNGLVQTYGSVSNSVAVFNSAGFTEVINNGTMEGDVLLTNAGGSGCFTNNGTFGSGDAVTVGSCGVTNAGVMNIGSVGKVGKTAISGDFTQLASGKLNIDADLQGGQSDVLSVSGKVLLAGTVNVNALSVSNKPVTVLTATGGVAIDAGLKQTDNAALFDFPMIASGNELIIHPTAHLSSAAADLNDSQKAVAGYLQKLFDSGATFSDGFTALSKLSGGADYSKSLASMTGDVLGAFGAFRVNSSRAFANNLYQGCRELTTDLNTSDSCSWARASGGSTDQSARGDTVGYHADAYTVDFGGQVGLSDRLALVGSLGYESSDFRGDDATSHIEGNAGLAGLGLNFVDGALELSGAIDGAYGWYRSYRTITVGPESQAANANPRQWQIGLHLRGGYEIPIGGSTYIKPFLDGHLIRVSNDSFTEDGNSPFRLTVDGRSDDAVQGGAGVEMGLHIPMRSGMEVHPFVSAAVEFGQKGQWTTSAHFASQSAAQGFSIRTAGPGTTGKFGIGADLVNAKNLSFSILYEPEIGDGYNYQGGAARISYRF